MQRKALATVLAVGLASSVGLAMAAGKAGGQGPKAASTTPLFDNLGSLHHPITTSSALAQRYFDQGLRLVYAFNHEEAVNSFREGARLDPNCAMCYWGIALALGPNINAPMDTAQVRPAYEAIQAARARASRAGERERAYIAALATRYAATPDAPRPKLDSAYASAMRALARRHPNDPDAATLFAEAMLDLRPWDQWTSDGRPRPGTEEVVAVLEGVLRRAPDHPGACHYYIHAVEASPKPERALPCARRLPSLMPGAGHLVHMPAHLYMRLGRYADAVRSNEHAAHADERYFEGRHPSGMYPFYYAHNLHFLWAAAAMEGRSAEALKAARQLAAQIPPDMARQLPPAEPFLPTPVFALARFGKWEELLREPAPPPDLRFATAIWHYGRGLALAATGRVDSARVAYDSLAAIAAAFPPDRPFGNNSAAAVLAIAPHALAGEIARRSGKADSAIAHFGEAVRLEDGLRYDEPPPWYYPVRQSLGAALLAAGRPAQAEAVYREDLRRNPENGWSLHGLAESLRAQRRAAEARAVEQRFQRAWARADVALAASGL